MKIKFVLAFLILAVSAFGQGRPTASAYTTNRVVSLAAIGDSLTQNYSYTFGPASYHPERVAVALRGLGATRVKARNFGISGNTTRSYTGGSTGMVERVTLMTRWDVPRLAVIWAGHNDSSHAAGLYIPAVASTYTEVTQSGIEAIVDALITAGCNMIVIVERHFLNYNTGDDTATVIDITTAPATTLHAAQYQAYLSRVALYPGKVAWCDLYARQRTYLIANPTKYWNGGTQEEVAAPARFLWMSKPSEGATSAVDVHLSAVGEQYVADQILDVIQAQSGWVAALTAAPTMAELQTFEQ